MRFIAHLLGLAVLVARLHQLRVDLPKRLKHAARSLVLSIGLGQGRLILSVGMRRRRLAALVANRLLMLVLPQHAGRLGARAYTLRVHLPNFGEHHRKANSLFLRVTR